VPVAGLSAGTRVPCPSCGCEIQVLDDASLRVHGDFAKGATIAGPSDEAGPPPAAAAVAGGAAAAAPSADLPPTPQEQGESPIPGYVVQSELGRGGMAVVFKARQISLERIVALKIMAERLAADPDFVKRFEREAKALAALNHPNITSVYDRGQAGKKIFFVMEFVEGRALRDVLDDVGGRIPQERALHLMVQVAEALAYVHDRGTIHRDIKPENVLVTAEDVVKVTDFGLAAMVDEGVNHNLTGANMMMGTLNYMPPEQRADAKSVDHRADIYSFGVMLYEVLTGTVPLGKWSPATELVPELDFRLDEIIGECLKNNRNDRYQSIAEARDALREVLEGPGQSLELNIPLTGADMSSQPPTPAPTAPPKEARKPPPDPKAPQPTVTPSRSNAPNLSDPGPSGGASRNAELESLVAQAKKNMQVQRTRGMPTRVQQFPGLDPPKRRGKIFLIALATMLVTVAGGYFLFEGPILVGFLVRTSRSELDDMKNQSLKNFLSNLRSMAQSRARQLSIDSPNTFRPALASGDSEKVKAGLALLSRSPHPDSANLVGNLLHHEDDEIYRWAVEALRRMASNQSAPEEARTAARTELTRATVGGDPKRVSVVKSVLRRLEEAESGDGGAPSSD
jgi:serine/threonine protein kinase